MRSSWSLLALTRRMRAVSGRELAVGVFLGLLLTSVVGYGGAFFVLLLLLLPVVVFFGRVMRIQTQYDITDREVAQLVITFLGGIFPGAVLAMTIESILAPLFAILCFYDQSDTLLPQLREFLNDTSTTTPSPSASSTKMPHSGRIASVIASLDIHKTFGYYAFLVLLAYVVAGLVEEQTKVWVVQSRCLLNCSNTRRWLCDPSRLLYKRVHAFQHHVVIVLAVIAAALGFSFIENIGFTFAVPTFSDMVESALLRSLVSLPFHGVCGAISGMRLARALLVVPTESSRCSRWRQKAWVLGPSVVLHGTFDFQIFVAASFISDDMAERHPFVVAFALPALLCLGVLVVAYKVARNEWQMLETVTGGKAQYAHLGAAENESFDEDDADSDEELVEEEDRHKPVGQRGVLLV